MKTKFALMLILLSVCSTSIFAQQKIVKRKTTQSFEFGVKGGLNFSQLNLSFTELDKNKTGFFIGGFASIPFGGKISLQPELLYSSKGAQVKYKFSDWFSGTSKLNLNYIDVPVAVHYKVSNSISIHGGGYGSWLTSSALKTSTSIPFLNFDINVPKSIFSAMDYGLIAGAEMDLGRLTLGGRYNYGLGKVEKTKNLLGADFNFSNARNTVWQLYAAIRF